MNYKIIRFKSNPKYILRRKSFFPTNKYHNKLFNILEVFSKHKNLESKIKDKKFLDFPIFDVTKKEINDIYILNNCNLLNFPIKLSANKFVETDYIEPFWSENLLQKHQSYKMISKQYILLERESNNSGEIQIIECKRLSAFIEQKPVKIYSFKLSENFEILYDEE